MKIDFLFGIATFLLVMGVLPFFYSRATLPKRLRIFCFISAFIGGAIIGFHMMFFPWNILSAAVIGLACGLFFEFFRLLRPY